MPVPHRITCACPILAVTLVSGLAAARNVDLPDPSPDPPASLASAAIVTPTHVLAGAPIKRAIDAARLPITLGALIAWPRDASGTVSPDPVVVFPTNGVRSERFGEALAQRPGLVAVGAPGFDASNFERASGRVHLLDERFAPIAILTPQEPLVALEFGSSLALDAERLLVGAPGGRGGSSMPMAGAVYVYAEARSGWTLERLIPSPNGDNSRFASALALTPTIYAIGAPGGGASPARAGRAGPPIDHGRVWLFDRFDARRDPIEVTAPALQINDRFGSAVASFQDLLVVGAPGCACEQGRVFVGRVGARGWTFLAELAPPDEPGWNGFGSSVAIAGPRLVVGTGGISADATGIGNRFATYRRSNDVWTLESTVIGAADEPAFGVVALDAAGVVASDPFGGVHHGGAIRYESVSREADLDGDGGVNAGDLAILLGAWGPTIGVSAADLDGDGNVGASDLALLLGGWTR